MSEYPKGESGWLFDLMIAVLVFIFCWLVMSAVSRYSNRAEKAAYLEGRYDLDHATAWHLAED